MTWSNWSAAKIINDCACRERGARVLEARLGAKDVVGGATPAVQLDPDIEAPKQINEESSV